MGNKASSRVLEPDEARRQLGPTLTLVYTDAYKRLISRGGAGGGVTPFTVYAFTRYILTPAFPCVHLHSFGAVTTSFPTLLSQRMFAAFDSRGSGEWSLDDFLAWCAVVVARPHVTPKASTLLRVYDVDNHAHALVREELVAMVGRVWYDKRFNAREAADAVDRLFRDAQTRSRDIISASEWNVALHALAGVGDGAAPGGDALSPAWAAHPLTCWLHACGDACSRDVFMQLVDARWGRLHDMAVAGGDDVAAAGRAAALAATAAYKRLRAASASGSGLVDAACLSACLAPCMPRAVADRIVVALQPGARGHARGHTHMSTQTLSLAAWLQLVHTVCYGDLESQASLMELMFTCDAPRSSGHAGHIAPSDASVTSDDISISTNLHTDDASTPLADLLPPASSVIESSALRTLCEAAWLYSRVNAGTRPTPLPGRSSGGVASHVCDSASGAVHEHALALLSTTCRTASAALYDATAAELAVIQSSLPGGVPPGGGITRAALRVWQHRHPEALAMLNLLTQALRVEGGIRPYTPSDGHDGHAEASIIRRCFRRFHPARARNGDVVYVIPSAWWRSWCDWSRFYEDSEDEVGDDAEEEVHTHTGPRRGLGLAGARASDNPQVCDSIPTRELMVSVWTPPAGGRPAGDIPMALRVGLSVGDAADLTLIPTRAWTALSQWYGVEGPAILRTVVSRAPAPSSADVTLECELYPMWFTALKLVALPASSASTGTGSGKGNSASAGKASGRWFGGGSSSTPAPAAAPAVTDASVIHVPSLVPVNPPGAGAGAFGDTSSHNVFFFSKYDTLEHVRATLARAAGCMHARARLWYRTRASVAASAAAAVPSNGKQAAAPLTWSYAPLFALDGSLPLCDVNVDEGAELCVDIAHTEGMWTSVATGVAALYAASHVNVKDMTAAPAAAATAPRTTPRSRSHARVSSVTVATPAPAPVAPAVGAHVYPCAVTTSNGAMVLAFPRTPPPVGLSNLGNTCYLAAALQCLIHTPTLTQYFNTDEWTYDINVAAKMGTGGHVAAAFADLVRELYTATAGGSIAPRRLKHWLSIASPRFTGNEQHDAHDAMSTLLTAFCEDCNRVPVKPYTTLRDSESRADAVVAEEWWCMHVQREQSIASSLCTGQFKSTLTCDNCGHTSARFEPFTVLSLPLPEPMHRHVTVTLVYASARPHIMTVRVPHSGSVRTVKEALAKLANEINFARGSDDRAASSSTQSMIEGVGAGTLTTAHVFEQCTPTCMSAPPRSITVDSITLVRGMGHTCEEEPLADDTPLTHIRDNDASTLVAFVTLTAAQVVEGYHAALRTLAAVGVSQPELSVGAPVHAPWRSSTTAAARAAVYPGVITSLFNDDVGPCASIAYDDGDVDARVRVQALHARVPSLTQTHIIHRSFVRAGAGSAPFAAYNATALGPVTLSTSSSAPSTPSASTHMSTLSSAAVTLQPAGAGALAGLQGVGGAPSLPAALYSDAFFMERCTRVCFGMPGLIATPPSFTTLEALYHTVARMAQRWIRTPLPLRALDVSGSTPDARVYSDDDVDSDEDSRGGAGQRGGPGSVSSGPTPAVHTRVRSGDGYAHGASVHMRILSRWGFLLRRTARTGMQCSICAWWKRCTGCVLAPDDNVLLSHMRMREGDAIAVEWDPLLLEEAFDRVESVAKDIHPSVATARVEEEAPLRLEACMDVFSRVEKLEEDSFCSKCSRTGDDVHMRAHTKRLEVWRTPPVLFVQLKRFQHTAYVRRKLQNLVDFPLRGLSLAPYMARAHVTQPPPDLSAWLWAGGKLRQETVTAVSAGGDAASAATPHVEQHGAGHRGSLGTSAAATGAAPPPPPAPLWRAQSESTGAAEAVIDGIPTIISRNRCEFDLYATVAHYGIMGAGHYVAYAQSPVDAKWRCFNDRNVSEADPADIVTPAAYLLCYARRDIAEGWAAAARMGTTLPVSAYADARAAPPTARVPGTPPLDAWDLFPHRSGATPVDVSKLRAAVSNTGVTAEALGLLDSMLDKCTVV